MYRLFERPGWGSAIIEAQLAWYGLPVELVPVGDLLGDEAARAGLARLNPLAQVPVLVLPSGEVMTESAAITLHLADLTGRDDLVPGPAAPERARFLRWLVFLVASVYPVFTFGEVPGRFVADGDAATYRDRIDRWHRRTLHELDRAAGAPWFLGQRFSAVDIYLAVMSHWSTGRDWPADFPALAAIVRQTEARPELAQVLRRNFADQGGS